MILTENTLKHPLEGIEIVKPNAYIIKPDFSEWGRTLLRNIETRARLSHRSEDSQTADSWQRLLQAVVINHGDWSVTEHESVTVLVTCDRGISHEWVRHRLGAYTQESTRFVNYKKKLGLSFVCPFDYNSEDKVERERLALWLMTIQVAARSYYNLLDRGVTPQIARSVLPNALATRFYVSYNLRMWRHFFIMRTTKETHPQMRQITIPLLREFQATIPLLFDDVLPEEKQSVALSKPR